MVNLVRPIVQPIVTPLVRQLPDELTQVDVDAASGGGPSPGGPSLDFSDPDNSQYIPII